MGEYTMTIQRETAKWSTDFEEKEGIYEKQPEERDENVEDSIKKSKVIAERKKWENIITSDKSNTFFFDSDNSDS